MKTHHIYLISEQLLPNMMHARWAPPDVAWLIATDKMNGGADLLATMLHRDGLGGFIERLPLGKLTDLMDFAEKLSERILAEYADDAVILNFTGGTKLMTIAFLFAFQSAYKDAGRASQFSTCYVDTEHHSFESLESDDTEIPSGLLSIDEHLCAHGIGLHAHNTAAEPGYLARARARHELTRALLRPSLDSLLTSINQQNSALPRWKGDWGRAPWIVSQEPLDLPCAPGSEASSAIAQCVALQLLTPIEQRFRFTNVEAARYLTGAWLEEFVWLALQDAIPDINPKDLRLGAFIDNSPAYLSGDELRRAVHAGAFIDNRPTSPVSPKGRWQNELDVLVLRDHRLLMVECKSGQARADDKDKSKAQGVVYKLDSLRHEVQGKFGEALLVNLHPLPPAVQKCASALGIKIVQGGNIARLPEMIAHWAAVGQWPH